MINGPRRAPTPALLQMLEQDAERSVDPLNGYDALFDDGHRGQQATPGLIIEPPDWSTEP